VECDDGNPCTTDGCIDGVGCKSTPADGPCDDGDPCTIGEQCAGGACTGGDAPDCDDGKLCTADSCIPGGGCQSAPAVGACDDGDACTTNDVCNGGDCIPGAAAACNDNNPCTADDCDPAAGCTHDPLDGVECPGGTCVDGKCGDLFCVADSPLLPGANPQSYDLAAMAAKRDYAAQPTIELVFQTSGAVTSSILQAFKHSDGTFTLLDNSAKYRVDRVSGAGALLFASEEGEWENSYSYLAEATDGSTLGLAKNKDTIQKLLPDGKAQAFYPNTVRAVLQLPNGNLAALDSEEKKLVELSASTGGLVQHLAIAAPMPDGPNLALHPDGSYWTIDTGNDADQFWRAEHCGTFAALDMPGVGYNARELVVLPNGHLLVQSSKPIAYRHDPANGAQIGTIDLPQTLSASHLAQDGHVYIANGNKVYRMVFPCKPGNVAVGDDCVACDQIATCEDLQAIGENATGAYCLANDIDCSQTETWNGGAGFDPLDNFEGSLEGGGHTISGLFLNRPTETYVALFAIVNGGTISNVRIVDADVTGETACAGLVAQSAKGVVDGCSASGSVICENTTGGLVAQNYGLVTDSSSTMSVTKTGVSGYAGVLVGANSQGAKVFRSSASGAVEDTWYAGGLVGINWDSTVEQSYATSTSTGSGWAAGLVAYNTSSNGPSTIRDCWAGGVVNASAGGGLVDGVNTGWKIENAYSFTQLKGDAAGGLIGDIDAPGTLTSSYWDVQVSGADSSAQGAGKTTAQMLQQATYTGWNFDTVWKMSQPKGYPCLQWQDEDTCPKIECGDGVVSPTETCDDGNTENGDACDSDCQLVYFPVNGPKDLDVADDGTLVVAHGGGGVKVSCFAPNGAAIGTTQLALPGVNPHQPAGWPHYYIVIADKKKHFAVSARPSNTSKPIRFYNKDCQPLTDVTPLEDPGNNTGHEGMDIQATDDGVFWAAYADTGGTRIKRYDSNGAQIGATQLWPGLGGYPKIALNQKLGNGAYSDQNHQSSPVRFRRFDKDGNLLDDEWITVLQSEGGHSAWYDSHCVAMSDDSEFVVAWSDGQDKVYRAAFYDEDAKQIANIVLGPTNGSVYDTTRGWHVKIQQYKGDFLVPYWGYSSSNHALVRVAPTGIVKTTFTSAGDHIFLKWRTDTAGNTYHLRYNHEGVRFNEYKVE